MARRGKSRKKVSHGLVALSSAAVAAVYSAGYVRTKPAAERFAVHAAANRSITPPVVQSTKVPTVAPTHPATPLPPVRKREPIASVGQPVANPPEAPVNSQNTPPPPAAQSPAEVAPAAPAGPATPAAPASAQPAYKDGTYYGWGSCQHGDIQAAVIVYGGVIQSAFVSQCLTRYSCSIIDKAQNQVVDRQAAKVDIISGATESVFAFQDAVAEALSQAK